MDISLNECPFIPSWARDFKDTSFFIYNGASMKPFFRPGDLLCASYTPLGKIHLGDIVIVKRESNINQMDYIVHRVIKVERELLLTRGDNNLKADIQAVTPQNLIGRVTSFGRQSHVYIVRGGILGLLYAFLCYIKIFIWMLIKRLGRRGYYLVHESGLIAKIWRPKFNRLRVMTDDGPLVKYCIGTKTVARWWPQQGRFNVSKPFDLVLSAPIEP